MPAAALFAAVTATTVAFYRIDPNAGHLMLPYLAFTGFANALNYRIWLDNPAVSVSMVLNQAAQPLKWGLKPLADRL